MNLSAHPSKSRRSFLKQTLGAGTGLALPNILTRPLFGAPSANSTVQVGLIGCGGIANYHRSNLAQMGDVKVIAVADAFRDRRDSFHEKAVNRKLKFTSSF